MPYVHFFNKKIFLRRLDFYPSRRAKKAPKATRVGFRSCSSALATLVPLSTPKRAAGSEVPGSAGALVRFSAHSPPTRRRSCFMPRGTARAHLTTHSKPVSKKIATSAHFRFHLILHFATRLNQGVTCQDVVRWVSRKFSYERPGTLGSPLGYILLPPPAAS